MENLALLELFSSRGFSAMPLDPDAIIQLSECRFEGCTHGTLDPLSLPASAFSSACISRKVASFNSLLLRANFIESFNSRVKDSLWLSTSVILPLEQLSRESLSPPLRHPSGLMFHQVLENDLYLFLESKRAELETIFKDRSEIVDFTHLVYAYSSFPWQTRIRRVTKVLFGEVAPQIVVVPRLAIKDDLNLWGAPVNAIFDVAKEDDAEVHETFKVLLREMPVAMALSSARALR